MGTLCAVDPEPHSLGREQVELLTVLARLFATQVERDVEMARREQAETALRQREQRFRALVERSSDIVMVADSEGTLTFVGASVQGLLGRDPASLEGNHVTTIVPPEDWESLDVMMKNVLAGRSTRSCPPFRLQDGHGSWRWFEATASNRIEVPEVRGIVLNLRDITDRLEAEAARARLAAIVESSEDAVISKTLDGTITSWNSAAERLYGYTSEEAVGRSIEMLIPQSGINDIPDLLNRVARGERIAHHDARRQTKDGCLLDVALTMSPVLSVRGAIIGASVIAHDVTELRRLQEERDRLHAELETEIVQAADVQSQLLPQVTPDIHGYEFAAICLPARHVGGDYYDWLVTDETVRLSLGDVMGKGMPAALLMASTRSSLRSLAHLSLDQAVTAANSALAPDLRSSDGFVTLFHAELWPATGNITFVDAGHGLAFVQQQDGTPRMLRERGLPLGILPDATYVQGATRLDPGETLVVFSDGLPDARPDLILDPPGIAERLCGVHDAQSMLDRLVAIANAGPTRPDDLTLLLVRRTDAAA